MSLYHGKRRDSDERPSEDDILSFAVVVILVCLLGSYILDLFKKTETSAPQQQAAQEERR